MLKLKIFILAFLLYAPFAWSAVYQWSVPVTSAVSGETNDHPRAFLWIPGDCQHVRAVVVGQHNMCEETIFDHPAFRESMKKLGFAIIWISPGIDQQWDVNNGCQKAFEKMTDDLADVN